MPSYNRTNAYYYADSFWDGPCHDNIIATSKGIVNVATEFKKRLKGEKRSDWRAQFVWNFVDPKTGKKHMEAACFIHNRTKQEVMFCPWKGMNDCAHYVSRCLGDGGMTSVYAAGVPQLESNLIGLEKQKLTKTFGDKVDVDRGQRIVDSGILKQGDVIIYYNPGGRQGAHSSFYLGEGKIACHTRARFEFDWPLDRTAKYRFIHFSHDDQPPSSYLKRHLIGWWEVNWGTAKYYYYSSAEGKVAYQKTPPRDTSRGISSPAQRGYWFGKNSREHTIIWAVTGTVEKFKLTGAKSQTGDYNDAKKALVAKKL
jgi:hypothetical protein